MPVQAHVLAGVRSQSTSFITGHVHTDTPQGGRPPARLPLSTTGEPTGFLLSSLLPLPCSQYGLHGSIITPALSTAARQLTLPALASLVSLRGLSFEHPTLLRYHISQPPAQAAASICPHPLRPRKSDGRHQPKPRLTTVALAMAIFPPLAVGRPILTTQSAQHEQSFYNPGYIPSYLASLPAWVNPRLHAPSDPTTPRSKPSGRQQPLVRALSCNPPIATFPGPWVGFGPLCDILLFRPFRWACWEFSLPKARLPALACFSFSPSCLGLCGTKLYKNLPARTICHVSEIYSHNRPSLPVPASCVCPLRHHWTWADPCLLPLQPVCCHQDSITKPVGCFIRSQTHDALFSRLLAYVTISYKPCCATVHIAQEPCPFVYSISDLFHLGHIWWSRLLSRRSRLPSLAPSYNRLAATFARHQLPVLETDYKERNPSVLGLATVSTHKLLLIASLLYILFVFLELSFPIFSAIWQAPCFNIMSVSCVHSFTLIKSDSTLMQWVCQFCLSGPSHMIYECAYCKLHLCHMCTDTA
ncbi:hypothetical protein IF2G_04646 [Cordyceps javanica]|nr:hypothetical protein IF2G_04646 [Cordyceps javanica]